MKNLIVLLFLALSACATINNTDVVYEGEFFASIYMTHGAYTGEVKEKTGFEFYIEKTDRNVIGPILNGYRFENGILIDTFSKGSESAETVKKIEGNQSSSI